MFNCSCRYSLSDSTSNDHFRISVKKDPGVLIDRASKVESSAARHPAFISNLLHAKVQVGDPIEVAYPFGDFLLDSSSSPIVLISAGVGLTPLLSMLNTIARVLEDGEKKEETGPQRRQVSWIQSLKSDKDYAFQKHIQGLVENFPQHIRSMTFFSQLDESYVRDLRKQLGDKELFPGRLNSKEHKDKLFLEDKKTQYYMCGPKGFMTAVETQLKDLHVDEQRIHSEAFAS